MNTTVSLSSIPPRSANLRTTLPLKRKALLICLNLVEEEGGEESDAVHVHRHL